MLSFRNSSRTSSSKCSFPSLPLKRTKWRKCWSTTTKSSIKNSRTSISPTRRPEYLPFRAPLPSLPTSCPPRPCSRWTARGSRRIKRNRLTWMIFTNNSSPTKRRTWRRQPRAVWCRKCRKPPKWWIPKTNQHRQLKSEIYIKWIIWKLKLTKWITSTPIKCQFWITSFRKTHSPYKCPCPPVPTRVAESTWTTSSQRISLLRWSCKFTIGSTPLKKGFNTK